MREVRVAYGAINSPDTITMRNVVAVTSDELYYVVEFKPIPQNDFTLVKRFPHRVIQCITEEL